MWGGEGGEWPASSRGCACFMSFMPFLSRNERPSNFAGGWLLERPLNAAAHGATARSTVGDTRLRPFASVRVAPCSGFLPTKGSAHHEAAAAQTVLSQIPLAQARLAEVAALDDTCCCTTAAHSTTKAARRRIGLVSNLPGTLRPRCSRGQLVRFGGLAGSSWRRTRQRAVRARQRAVRTREGV